ANSLLHSVMSRRLGIPLTLSIVFMEIGWRIGVPFEGVGFPGHFLVRLTGEPGDLLLDPYDHGASVHEEDCRRMIELTTGGPVPYDPSMIRSLGKRDMIARLLFNLKVACLKAGDDKGALSAVERLLLLHPDDPPELRDRGLLLYRMDRYREARASLEAHLRSRPDALDRQGVERHLMALQMMLAGDRPRSSGRSGAPLDLGDVLQVRRLHLRARPRALHHDAAARALEARRLALLGGGHPAIHLRIAARRVAQVDAQRHGGLLRS